MTSPPGHQDSPTWWTELRGALKVRSREVTRTHAGQASQRAGVRDVTAVQILFVVVEKGQGVE